MQVNLLLSLFLLFFSTLVVALFLYWIGGRVGVKGKKSIDKVSTYACGEDLPSRQVQVDVERFFIYAVYFLIFDVLAVFLATSLNTPGFFPALYAMIVLMAVVFLLPFWQRE